MRMKFSAHTRTCGDFSHKEFDVGQRPATHGYSTLTVVSRARRELSGRNGRGAMSTSRRLWPTLKQVLRREELMDRMMYTIGVDVNTAVRTDGGLAFLEARAKCRYCIHEKSCRDWLESTEGVRLSPDFCPNARFFLSCRTIEC